MKGHSISCFVVSFCLSLTVAGFSQSQNVKSVARTFTAGTSGNLSDGGFAHTSLSVGLTPNSGVTDANGGPCNGITNAPNCLTVMVVDALSPAFGQTDQVLQPGEFTFDAKNLTSATVNTTLTTPDPIFSGVQLDLKWTANSPVIKGTSQQHTTAQFHVHTTGSTRFAVLSGTDSLTTTDINGNPVNCCTWAGDAQMSKNLTTTLQIIKP